MHASDFDALLISCNPLRWLAKSCPALCVRSAYLGSDRWQGLQIHVADSTDCVRPGQCPDHGGCVVPFRITSLRSSLLKTPIRSRQSSQSHVVA